MGNRIGESRMREPPHVTKNIYAGLVPMTLKDPRTVVIKESKRVLRGVGKGKPKKDKSEPDAA